MTSISETVFIQIRSQSECLQRINELVSMVCGGW